MKLDPRHLEILAAIVEEGGLTEGAAALGKSQPSVSRSLALLESRVGQHLFEPRRRPLRPTELGQSLALEGKKILDANRAASALVTAHSRGLAGAIRVAGTPIFMDGVISGLIAQFHADHPGVRIDQSYAYASEALEKVANDQLDLAILPLRAADVPASFAFRQILPGRNVIACRSGHPLTRRKDLSPKDVLHYPWIAPPANSPLFQDLRALLDRIGHRELKIGFTGGSLSAVLNVLSSSESLTVLPFSVVHTVQRYTRLDMLPIDMGGPDRHLGIVTLKAKTPHQAAQRFSDFLDDHFQGILRQIVAEG